MAGPGIRFWELGRVLSRQFDVTLAVPPFVRAPDVPIDSKSDLPVRARACRSAAEVRSLARQADIVVTQGAVALMLPFLGRLQKPLVFDSYDPFLLASLEQFVDAEMGERLSVYKRYRDAHLTALLAADFVLCASEKQRDYFLGMLSAIGRMNPQNHDEDPGFRRLIDVVPYGLPEEPPRRTRSVLKGVYPGIAAEDRVVLWGGGIWNWFDSETAVQAMARVARKRGDVRLFFMGTAHPSPSVARMRAVDDTIALSEKLGLKDRFVFFNDWVPYAERENYLLEADVGLSLHRDVLETRLAFRTRLLDYFWAELPIVATEGDVLSEEVRRHEVGRIVTPGDADAVAEAILALVATKDPKDTYRPRFSRLKDAYRWDVVAEPLIRFCHDPRLAPDRELLRTLRHPLSFASWRRILKEMWTTLADVPARARLRDGQGADRLRDHTSR